MSVLVHLVQLAEGLRESFVRGDLVEASRVLRRVEHDLAREIDRRNAPRSQIVPTERR